MLKEFEKKKKKIAMTMDYTNQSRAEIKMPSPRISSTDNGTCQTKLDNYTSKGHIKRSFDVAFLMLPDEKLKQKQHEKQQRLNADAIVTYSQPQISVKSGESLKQQQQSPINEHPMRYFHQQKHPNNDDLDIELINNNDQDIHVSRFITSSTSPSNRSPRTYDDPSIITNGRYNNDSSNDAPKSAFTKVPHLRQESPPLSPDQLSCPSSSPPISSSPPQHIIYQSFRPEYRFVNHGQFQAISQMQAQNQKFKQQFMYRPIHNPNNSGNINGIENGYINPGNFPFGTGGGGHPFVTQPDLTGIVRNPAAAALLTTLIPPTIATTFTLTAQNVCAKCNISFRMTSDLVYHMRSHHKSEFTTDTNRRKREEKLKCPVCNESFRERHHLTRHMTAHQDKASDEAETIQMQRRHK